MTWIDFYNERWKKKAFKSIERFSFFHRADNLSFFRDILRWNLAQKGGTFLDAGCGWSIHGDLLSDHYSAPVVKLDLSYMALRHIPKVINPINKCGLVNSNLETLPFKSNSFSFIICSQVIEHVPNTKLVLQEFFRILKPAGVLILAVPNCYRDLGKMFHKLEQQFDQSGHIHEFCKEQMKDLLESNGFIIQKIRYHCHYIFAFWAWLERTKGGEKISAFFSRHKKASTALEYVITYMLFIENILLGNHAHSALSIEFVVRRL